MSGTLIVALVVVGIFLVIVLSLWWIKPSEPDAVTREVIEQGLTGPVVLPPAPHTRIQAPNRQDTGDEAP